jgi:hypothetical protein
VDEYREIWTDADFDDMRWSDATLYSMAMPRDGTLSFDIDHLFKWHHVGDRCEGWDIAPCTLRFENVSGLNASLNWMNVGHTIYGYPSIHYITRRNARPTANGKLTVWDYEILLNLGEIHFSSTGYKQTLRSPAVFSETQDLPRATWRP